MTNILQSIRKLKASIAVLVGDDRKIIEMIKHEYLKESILPENDEDKRRKLKLRPNYMNFVNMDERKVLRSERLGMYFRQSLVGMVAFKEHGNVLQDDFDSADCYDEE